MKNYFSQTLAIAVRHPTKKYVKEYFLNKQDLLDIAV